MWDDQCLAVDQGDAAAEWFSTFLDRKCRLVMMEPDFVRRVDPKRLPDHVFSTTFTDGYQVLLASTASLRALNERLPEPVLMNRFRPNIVIGGAEPFEEDSWKRIKINAITMRVVKPCARCAVVSVNQEEATITKEPMHALAEFRNVDGKVLFGQYLAHESVGTISAGDEIRVLEKG